LPEFSPIKYRNSPLIPNSRYVKPSIAVLTPIADVGGAEISFLELAARLSDQYQFHFIVPGDGPLKARAERLGATTWVLDWPKDVSHLSETRKKAGLASLLRGASSLPNLARQLSERLDRIRPSIFVTNAIKCHLLGSLAHRRKGIPLVWYMRDGMEERAMSRRVLRLLRSRCDAAICISQYVASEVRSYISSTLPVSVIYNIVDLNQFQPGLPAPLDLLKKPGEVWFGNVGAITPLKGQDLFLRAAEIVSRQLPQARFFVVGSALYKTQSSADFDRMLRRQAESCGLKDKVEFLGFRSDLPAILSNLDVLVQSNRGPEGLGRSVIEAMASAIPSVVVDRWGPAELIVDGNTGFSFAAGDVEGMASRMLLLGTNPWLRTKLGCNARTWVEQNLASERVVSQARTFFDQLLRGTAPACVN